MLRLRGLLARLFTGAVAAVAPGALVARHLRVEGSQLVLVSAGGGRLGHWPLPQCILAVGKAAAQMAAACDNMPALESAAGIALVPDGCAAELRRSECVAAGHPLPDQRGVDATRRMLALAARLPSPATLLCLVSGGASSLLVCPRPPVTLADKIAATDLLLKCGAGIHEINTVRKHLSEVKGGGLLRACKGTVVTLLLSDVIGDDPAVIGSGSTVPDPTTFTDARAVLCRYDLWERVPASVRALMDAGERGETPDTLKPDDPRAAAAFASVIGSNKTAISAAASEARRLGWLTEEVGKPVCGDTHVAAQEFAALLRRQLRAAREDRRQRCVVAGGETTVRVVGPGKGGRNQEFALVLASEIAGLPIAVLSAGTDGIDGPTEVAGAFADGTTRARARAQGLDTEAVLERNDSYALFDQLGDHFRPGPTGTNVMDLKIAVVLPES